jgi:hypothetical protein
MRTRKLVTHILTDTVFIETGPYKDATATVMRLTPKKMEVYLHDRKYNGKAVMLNQSSGWVINGKTSGWVKNKRHTDIVQASNAPPHTPLRVADAAMCRHLQDEIAQLQTKLAMMALVVDGLQEREKVRNEVGKRKPPNTR